ncbi:MAG: thiamine diphosphokinase [Deinococcales bacterium]
MSTNLDVASYLHHAFILVAGELLHTPRVRLLTKDAQLVIAADGGARHALALGLEVTCWVGDFDSSEGIFLDAPRQTFPREKDSTDLELALLCAKERGATSATILGAFGGRFDHALGIALLAAKESRAGFEVRLESGSESAWVLTGQHSIALEHGQTFSVLALEPSQISLSGAKWNLSNAQLLVGSGLGISNIALGEVFVEVHSGCALLVAQF